MAAVARTHQPHRDDFADSARTRRHHDDPVGEIHRLFDVVRHHDHGAVVLAVNAEQFFLKMNLCHCVERAEGFIEEQQFRFVDESAGDCAPLRHSAGELRRICPCKFIKSDEFQISGHDFRCFGAVGESECNVFFDGEPRHEPRFLKNESAVASRLSDGFPVEFDFALEVADESGDDPEHGRLAAPRPADDCDEFTTLNLEVDVAQNFNFASVDGEAFVQVPDGKYVVCFVHGQPPCLFRCWCINIPRISEMSTILVKYFIKYFPPYFVKDWKSFSGIDDLKDWKLPLPRFFIAVYKDFSLKFR